jgi:putative flippase GtrA
LVSVVSTTSSLVVLGLLVGVFRYSATLSNVAAIAVGTVPSFELNRRWVWSQAGRRSLLRQVLPFSLLSFAGLVLSTISVHVVSGATASASRVRHTFAVEMANFGSYAVLWLAQFVLCDRLLFQRRRVKTTSRKQDAMAPS